MGCLREMCCRHVDIRAAQCRPANQELEDSPQSQLLRPVGEPQLQFSSDRQTHVIIRRSTLFNAKDHAGYSIWPLHSTWPQRQFISGLSPMPSHCALQYPSPSGTLQEQAGCLHWLSANSAFECSIGLVIVC